MGYADLHIHSNFSHDGTCSVQGILEYAAEKTNLSVIAITDHDEIAGSLLAEKLAPAYGLHVITGSEISTAEGHLLALFIRQRIPSGLSLIDTLLAVGKLGGNCIAAHPSAQWAKSLSLEAIENALNHPEAGRVLVGMEVFNAGLFRKESNNSALEFAASHDTSLVANSDAHLDIMIGRGTTGFSGNSIRDLRIALETHQTRITQFQPVKPSRIIFGWMVRRIFKHLPNPWDYSSNTLVQNETEQLHV